jgi:hypothetical protein
MNAMGHNVPTLLGAQQEDVARRIQQHIPGYMLMGDKGMHDMTEMEMPLPDNTLPMMTGEGPFGGVGMGGMFSVLKVRKNQPHGDYRDPGWYEAPAGTRAYEWTGTAPATPRAATAPASATLQVRKPAGHSGH